MAHYLQPSTWQSTPVHTTACCTFYNVVLTFQLLSESCYAYIHADIRYILHKSGYIDYPWRFFACAAAKIYSRSSWPSHLQNKILTLQQEPGYTKYQVKSTVYGGPRCFVASSCAASVLYTLYNKLSSNRKRNEKMHVKLSWTYCLIK